MLRAAVSPALSVDTAAAGEQIGGGVFSTERMVLESPGSLAGAIKAALRNPHGADRESSLPSVEGL